MITPEKDIVIVDLSESLLQRHSAKNSNSRKNKLQELSSDAIEEFLAYQKNIPSEWWALLVGWELRQMWSLCGTYIVISIFNLMLSIVTQMFVGRHLGTMALAGASMATLEVQGLAFIVMSGMAIAVQTSCGEAYRTRKYDSLGIICQQGVIVQLGAAVMLSFLYWYSGTVLQTLGLWAAIADQTQIFARGLLPQLYAYALSFPMQRFLQAQNIVTPLAYSAIGVLLFHLALTWLVVVVFNYGLLGAALTLGFSWWLLVIITGLYIILSPSCEKSWTGFSTNAFKGLWAYSKLALSAIFILSFESWYIMGIVLSSAYFANTTVSVASFAICINYLNMDLTFMLGMSTAAIIRVSTEIECANPKVARFSAMVVNATSILISIILSTIIIACGTTLGKAFIGDDEVIKAVSEFTPLLAISVLLNGVEPILSGVATGIGRPGLVVCFYVCNYYLIGLTVGYALGFMTYLGVAGIWWGVILGFSLQTLVLVIVVATTDWDKEVDKALDRLKQCADEEILA